MNGGDGQGVWGTDSTTRLARSGRKRWELERMLTSVCMYLGGGLGMAGLCKC